MKKIIPFLLIICLSCIAKGQDIAVNSDIHLPTVASATASEANWADPTIFAFSNTNICVDDSVLIGVNNLPSDALGYNWQKDGVAITGANKVPFPAKQAGVYTLSVTLANGTVFITNSVTVTFASASVAPVITAKGSTSFCNGQSVVLSSSDPGNIQWQKDGINILNAQAQTYTATVGGNYRIKFTPLIGCPGYSNEITVSVTNIVGPTITESVHAVPVCIGSSIRLTSSVSVVQWQKDGVDIVGATGQFVDITANGTYRAIQPAVGGGCSAISNQIIISSFLPVQPTPVITANGSTSICSGSNVVLTSSISSSSSSVVQWRLNGVDISGATSSTYLATQSGDYTAYVTGSTFYCNNIGTPSNTITVTVNPAPTAAVVTASGNLTFCSGSSVTFNSNIANVQWQKDSIDISGAFGSSYAATQSGIYRAVVKGVNGCNAYSNAYTVVVIAANATPVVTAASATNICTGSSVILASNVAGVQWQLNGVDISGAVLQTYTATQAGTYRAYVSTASSCGLSYSNTITVTVSGSVAIPVITATGPTTFCDGNNVILQSSVPNVQWRLNSTNVGSLGTAYSATVGGSYTAIASNGGCRAVSNAIIVTVVTPSVAPVITASGATTFCNGGSVSFLSNVAGVQWQLNGVDISGATSQAYTAALAGVYRAYIPSAACSNAYSNTLVATVSTPPTAAVITASGAVNFCSGGSVTLSSNAYPVQWQMNGTNIGTLTSSALVVTTAGSYTAVRTSGACSVTSNAINVVVSSPSTAPVITAATTTSICTGSTVTLSSNIGGIQWQLNGVDINGAVFQAYNASSAGVYRAYIPGSAACGTAYSNTITVTVSTLPTAPTITAASSLNICSGGSVVLSSASGAVLWQKDGVNISANPTSTITAITAGSYTAYTTNGNCISYSTPLVVTVSATTIPAISAINGSNVICGTNGVTLTSTVADVQWQLNGVSIPAAVGATYTTAVAGTYTAVTTASCSIVSNSVILTSASAPVVPVISANGSVNLCSGGTVTLTSSTPSIQWQKDGVDISGSVAQTLIVTSSGTYKAYSTNGTCKSVSNAITVTISNSVAPVISVASGASLAICPGLSGVVLSSSVIGVQWQLNGVNITGAAAQTYTATVAGIYTAVVAGNTCSSNSLVVTVAANPVTPIVSATGSTTFCSGDSVTLASNVAGVQWLKDSATIVGATSQTLVVKQSGRYIASISNSAGCTAYSSEVLVTVNTPAIIPIISTNNNLNVCSGTNVTLTSSVAGVTWQKDGIVVAANTQSYIATSSGNYRAFIPSGSCIAYSNILTLTVVAAPVTPTIVPSGPTTFCDSGSVTLVSNYANIQWYKDGVAINGAINSTYTATKAGVYKVASSNSLCITYSNEIAVVVNSPTVVPVVIASGNLNICSGTPLTLSTNTAGVVWQKDGVTIASGVQSLPVTQSGIYQAILFGTGCPGYSNSLAVTVSPSPGTPFITATGATTFCDSSNVILVSTLPNVQWQKDGIDISGATTQTLTATASGTYRAYVANSTCINYSNEIPISVNKPPIIPIISASGSLNTCSGSPVTLTSSVANVAWQKDFVTIATNTQSITASVAGSYRAVILSSTCPAYSTPVQVSVTPSPAAPTITALGSTTFCDSGFVTLSSNIAGVQWLMGGNIIQNAFGQTYTATKAGVYTAVQYGNNGCNGISNAITTTTTPAAFTPIIVNLASSNSFCAGSSVTLVSSVIDVSWQKDGVTIANPGNNSQLLPVTQAGTYRAVYNKSACPGYSNAITLTTIPQPLTPIAYRVTQNLCDTGFVSIASTLNTGTMQWQKDSVDIAGATSSTYLAKESGVYRMVISIPGACPSYSQNLPITINTALIPVIVWDGNQFKTFTLYSNYQWYLNNVAIAGATTNTYKPTTPGNYKVIVTAGPNCIFTSDVYQLLVTAVTTPTVINGATVKQYPNPAANEAWVEFSQIPTKPVMVRLLSATGAVLQTQQTRQKKISLPIANYTNGLYFIEVIGTDERIVYKLVVNK
jgi:hypothetical protein